MNFTVRARDPSGSHHTANAAKNRLSLREINAPLLQTFIFSESTRPA